jgi:hypothetical protein
MNAQALPREVAASAAYYQTGTRLRDGEQPETAQLRPDLDPRVAQGLGLDTSRALRRDEIAALLAGRRADGAKVAGKTYAELRSVRDQETGETRESVPIGSYDFCFSPDKSVSVAWAFATPAERTMIYAAHRDAVHAALLFVAAQVGQARIGKAGQDGAEPGHVAWIAFDHYTARPTQDIVGAPQPYPQLRTENVYVPVFGDPQLHTHNLMPNVVFCDSGRVGSLDTAQVQGIVKEVGALYQAHLAAGLRAVGADVAIDQKTGAARLTAIPEPIITHFSKKTAKGDHAAKEYARELGLDWEALSPARRARLLKEATQGRIVVTADPDVNRRLAKDDMPAFADWERQAAQLRYRHETVIVPRDQRVAAPEPSQEDRIRQAYDAALPWLEQALKEKAVLTASEVRTAALRGLIEAGITDTADVSRVTRRFWTEGVRQHGEATTLIYGREEVNGRERINITTALHRRDERDFVRLAKAAAGDRRDALSPGQIGEAVRGSGLRFDDAHGAAQLAAIHRLGEGGRLGMFIATAGAGKTTAMAPLVAAWQAQGRDVHGIALAWRQADDLVGAGIPAEARVKGAPGVAAVSAFFRKAAAGDIVLTARSVVVVDEVSLLGTRQGLELLRLQHRHGFRMVLLGDDKQCQSIEAGATIELAREALGPGQVPEVLTTRRQQSAREREIVGLFRAGKAAEALARKREDGTVELVPGGYREAMERTAALLGDLLRANAGNPRYTLSVSTATNADAHRLGVAIRQVRRDLGQVGADAVTLRAVGRDGEAYTMRLAPGDRVRLFRNTGADGQRGAFARNGSILTVLEADARGMRVRNPDGREGRIAWSRIADGHGRPQLAYGEASTTHTSQGSNTGDHIYALPGGTRTVPGPTAYSSGTRHEHTSYMILSEGAERTDVQHQRPVNDRQPITQADLWANIARHFARQPRKDTATAFLARATGVRQGSARGFRQGAQVAELRARRGQPVTVLAQRLQQRRHRHATAAVAQDLEPAIARNGGVFSRMAAIERETAAVVQERAARRQEAVARHRSGIAPHA